MPARFGAFPGGLNSSFTPFSATDLKIATLPFDSKTAMSLQLGDGAKLILDAGDGSSTAWADIGGGTTMCFIGVSSNLTGNEQRIFARQTYCDMEYFPLTNSWNYKLRKQT